MRLKTRSAELSDTDGMSRILERLVVAGMRSKPFSASFVREHYVEHPDRIECTIAEDERDNIIGFQSLKSAVEGNAYNTPAGWGIIGTHISPAYTRRGVGKRLFAVSYDVARKLQLSKIDAFIGKKNIVALAYYEAMGFRTYRTSNIVVQKCFRVI